MGYKRHLRRELGSAVQDFLLSGGEIKVLEPMEPSEVASRNNILATKTYFKKSRARSKDRPWRRRARG